MRVYRIDFDEPDGDGWRVRWARTKREAGKAAAEIRREMEAEPVVNVVSVPTDKAGLVDWLNANLSADGG